MAAIKSFRELHNHTVCVRAQMSQILTTYGCHRKKETAVAFVNLIVSPVSFAGKNGEPKDGGGGQMGSRFHTTKQFICGVVVVNT